VRHSIEDNEHKITIVFDSYKLGPTCTKTKQWSSSHDIWDKLWLKADYKRTKETVSCGVPNTNGVFIINSSYPKAVH